MSDREILELAAKAAGLDDALYEDMRGWGEVRHGFSEAMWSSTHNEERGTGYWNPLQDDGDAFRLACDLGLRVFPIARTESGAACSAVGAVTGERLSEVADASLDTQAATRRAIVRAAAEIGREGK